MTDNEMRIVIAEKCGWKQIKIRLEDDLGPIGNKKETRWLNPNPNPDHIKHLYECPDYPNDLNAMHEAEKLLDELDAKHDFATGLIPSLVYGGWLVKLANRSNPFHATARHRAEAFIKTVCPEKWEND